MKFFIFSIQWIHRGCHNHVSSRRLTRAHANSRELTWVFLFLFFFLFFKIFFQNYFLPKSLLINFFHQIMILKESVYNNIKKGNEFFIQVSIRSNLLGFSSKKTSPMGNLIFMYENNHKRTIKLCKFFCF